MADELNPKRRRRRLDDADMAIQTARGAIVTALLALAEAREALDELQRDDD